MKQRCFCVTNMQDIQMHGMSPGNARRTFQQTIRIALPAVSTCHGAHHPACATDHDNATCNAKPLCQFVSPLPHAAHLLCCEQKGLQVHAVSQARSVCRLETVLGQVEVLQAGQLSLQNDCRKLTMTM